MWFHRQAVSWVSWKAIGMEFLLLGLVGVSILAAVGADSSDEEETTEETSQEEIEPAPSDPVETGRDLSFDGSTVLEGTAGDDTIAAGQDSDLAPEEIRLQGGDDIAVIEDQIGGGVYGGAGDDTLTSTEYGNALHGGAGDDILSGVGGNVMSGGAGNDQISLDMNAQPGPDAFRINGGDGDDTIKVQADVGMDTPDRSGANFIGGAGEDAYEFDLTLKNSDVDLNLSGGPLSTSLGQIEDFDPAEDSLLIELDADTAAAARDVEASLEQTETDGQFFSTLTLRFLEDADTPDASEAVALLNIVSNSAFTLDDVQLVGV